MAKTGHEWLCLFLLLATFAPCVLGDLIGTQWLHNNAVGDMSVLTTTFHDDGSSISSPEWVEFPQGQDDKGGVGSGTSCIQYEFRLLSIDGTFAQLVPVWCKTGMPFNCLPDCHWEIDNQSFRVANSNGDFLWVYGWNKA